MADTPQTQDAIALLKADHRKVEELFASFENARGAERKQTLVQQICTELTVHTIIEEEIFYPACKVRIPRDRGHGFHGNMGTISTRRWARIPRDRGRPLLRG